MSTAGERLIAGMTEAVAIAKGEQPAARITMQGHHYVPEGAVAEAVAAERERCAAIATRYGDGRESEAAGARIAKKRFEARDYESMAISAYQVAAAIKGEA